LSFVGLALAGPRSDLQRKVDGRGGKRPSVFEASSLVYFKCGYLIFSFINHYAFYKYVFFYFTFVMIAFPAKFFKFIYFTDKNKTVDGEISILVIFGLESSN